MRQYCELFKQATWSELKLFSAARWQDRLNWCGGGGVRDVTSLIRTPQHVCSFRCCLDHHRHGSPAPPDPPPSSLLRRKILFATRRAAAESPYTTNVRRSQWVPSNNRRTYAPVFAEQLFEDPRPRPHPRSQKAILWHGFPVPAAVALAFNIRQTEKCLLKTYPPPGILNFRCLLNHDAARHPDTNVNVQAQDFIWSWR